MGRGGSPDTGMYTANTSDVAILKRAYQKMVKAVDTVWKGRAEGLPYKRSGTNWATIPLLKRDGCQRTRSGGLSLINRL